MRSFILVMLALSQIDMAQGVLADDTIAETQIIGRQLTLADQAIQAGRLVQADAMLTQLEIDAAGDAPSSLIFVRAKYHAVNGNVEAAAAQLSRVDLTKIDRCEGDGLTGWIATEQSQWNKAILQLASAVEQCGDDPVLWNMLGLALLAKHEYTAAIEAFDSALLGKPEHPALLNNRALALIGDNQLAVALRDLNLAIGHEPENTAIQNNIDYLTGLSGISMERRGSDSDTVWAMRLARAGDGARGSSRNEQSTAYFANAAILLDHYDAQIWQRGDPGQHSTRE